MERLDEDYHPTLELTHEEVERLLEETKDIEVGRKPILHEFLDRLTEILGE